jgi:hypothetical protein
MESTGDRVDLPARVQAICRIGECRSSGRASARQVLPRIAAETKQDPMHQNGSCPGAWSEWIADRTPYTSARAAVGLRCPGRVAVERPGSAMIRAPVLKLPAAKRKRLFWLGHLDPAPHAVMMERRPRPHAPVRGGPAAGPLSPWLCWSARRTRMPGPGARFASQHPFPCHLRTMDKIRLWACPAPPVGLIAGDR